MPDIVTISLFSVETNLSPGFKRGFEDQFSNVKKICDGLAAAAKKTNHNSPIFILSVLLIPDWENKTNSYDNMLYQRKSRDFQERVTQVFGKIPGVQVEDFYSEGCSLSECKQYMDHLKALGSNADLIKTISIIRNANRYRHLQIDSNTVVPCFDDLYVQTFGAAEQKDGINACFYDEDYISAHNKMVYTTPTGLIAKTGILKQKLIAWCREHIQDNEDKLAHKNSIYARVFTDALFEIGYVNRYEFKNNKVRFAATLSPQVYWLTDCMVTAVNMSWSANQGQTGLSDELKGLSPIEIGSDGVFNIQCFFNVIKKHTYNLKLHSVMLGIEDDTKTGEESRKLLLAVSNTDLELKAIEKFYIFALREHPECAGKLARFFLNTPLGNSLTQKVFGKDVLQLQAEANSIAAKAIPSARFQPL